MQDKHTPSTSPRPSLLLLTRVVLASMYLAVAIVQGGLHLQGRMHTSPYQGLSSLALLGGIIFMFPSYMKLFQHSMYIIIAVTLSNICIFISIIFLYIGIFQY